MKLAVVPVLFALDSTLVPGTSSRSCEIVGKESPCCTSFPKETPFILEEGLLATSLLDEVVKEKVGFSKESVEMGGFNSEKYDLASDDT